MDFLFGLDKPTKADENTSLLVTTQDPIELEIIRDILQTEGIPCRTKERGVGSSVKVIAGYSRYGTDVFVPTSALERAMELLDAFRNGEIVEDEIVDAEEV